MTKNPFTQVPDEIASKHITVDGLKLHYLEAGSGEVVLLLHGFPTSSYLYRNIIPKISKTHRAIALDLPGFGKSDKPLAASYSMNYYVQILSKFINVLSIKSVHLVVHDLGGPIGLLWAVRNQTQLKSLVLLNTLVYSKVSWAVKLFILSLRLPFTRNWITSKSGIAWTMRLGIQNKERVKGILAENYQKPFLQKPAQRALIKSSSNISLKAFLEIEERLNTLIIPVRVIYGVKDQILPKVGDTFKRIQEDLPNTEVTALMECGHFLQEDEPEIVAKLISEFLNQ